MPPIMAAFCIMLAAIMPASEREHTESGLLIASVRILQTDLPPCIMFCIIIIPGIMPIIGIPSPSSSLVVSGIARDPSGICSH